MQEVNFDSDWKLVTVYVGTGDLCAYCNDQVSVSENRTLVFGELQYISVSCSSLQVNLSPQNYTHNLMLGLDMLYSQVRFCICLQSPITDCLLHKWLMFFHHRCPPSVRHQVPRLLVNVVELMQLDPVKTVMKSTIGCSFFSRYFFLAALFKKKTLISFSCRRGVLKERYYWPFILAVCSQR